LVVSNVPVVAVSLGEELWLVEEFLEAGKRRLAGDTARAATSGLRPV
jgi:hypothetical protein